MNPLVALIGVGTAGFAAFKTFGKKSDVQVQNVVGTGGVPVKIITSIPKTVTPNQKAGISHPPAPTKSAVPHTSSAPGKGTVFAPAKAIVQTPQGVQPVPVIATPTGSSSMAISTLKDVQRALNTLGYMPPLKEDGILGAKTAANVRAFQSKSGLVADGNAGPATKAALSNALSGLASGGRAPINPAAAPSAVSPPGHRDTYNDGWAAPKTPPTAKETAAGVAQSLRDIQRNLNLLGANPKLKEDGIGGPKTVAAIKSFQVGHGLAADGIAGPQTKAMIFQLAHAPVKQFTGEFNGGFG